MEGDFRGLSNSFWMAGIVLGFVTFSDSLHSFVHTCSHVLFWDILALDAGFCFYIFNKQTFGFKTLISGDLFCSVWEEVKTVLSV